MRTAANRSGGGAAAARQWERQWTAARVRYVAIRVRVLSRVE
jgi:hypothetical protein